jgi:hypothetical protein
LDYLGTLEIREKHCIKNGKKMCKPRAAHHDSTRKILGICRDAGDCNTVVKKYRQDTKQYEIV